MAQRSVVLIHREGVEKLLARRNVSHGVVAKQLRVTASHWSRLVNGHLGVSSGLRTRMMRLRVFRGRGVTWETLFVIALGDI